MRRRRPSAREGVEKVTNEAMVEEVSAQLVAESTKRADISPTFLRSQRKNDR